MTIKLHKKANGWSYWDNLKAGMGTIFSRTKAPTAQQIAKVRRAQADAQRLYNEAKRKGASGASLNKLRQDYQKAVRARIDLDPRNIQNNRQMKSNAWQATKAGAANTYINALDGASFGLFDDYFNQLKKQQKQKYMDALGISNAGWQWEAGDVAGQIGGYALQGIAGAGIMNVAGKGFALAGKGLNAINKGRRMKHVLDATKNARNARNTYNAFSKDLLSGKQVDFQAFNKAKDAMDLANKAVGAAKARVNGSGLIRFGKMLQNASNVNFGNGWQGVGNLAGFTARRAGQMAIGSAADSLIQGAAMHYAKDLQPQQRQKVMRWANAAGSAARFLPMGRFRGKAFRPSVKARDLKFNATAQNKADMWSKGPVRLDKHMFNVNSLQKAHRGFGLGMAGLSVPVSALGFTPSYTAVQASMNPQLKEQIGKGEAHFRDPFSLSFTGTATANTRDVLMNPLGSIKGRMYHMFNPIIGGFASQIGNEAVLGKNGQKRQLNALQRKAVDILTNPSTYGDAAQQYLRLLQQYANQQDPVKKQRLKRLLINNQSVVTSPYAQYAMSKLDNADYRNQIMQDVKNKSQQFFDSRVNNINDIQNLARANAQTSLGLKSKGGQHLQTAVMQQGIQRAKGVIQQQIANGGSAHDIARRLLDIQKLGNLNANSQQVAWFRNFVGDQMFQQLKRNPFKLNQTIGIMFQQLGLDGAAQVANNPYAFYGIVAGIPTLLALINGGGGNGQQQVAQQQQSNPYQQQLMNAIQQAG